MAMRYAGLFDASQNATGNPSPGDLFGTPLSVASSSRLLGTTPFTIGCYYRSTDGTIAGYLQPLISKFGPDGSGTQDYLFATVNPSGNLLWALYPGGSGVTYTSTATLTANTDYFLAASWDGTKIHVFINAVEDGTGVTCGTTTASASPFMIGGDNSGRGFKAGGKIGGAFKFPFAATTTQLGYLYNSGYGRNPAEILAHFSSTPPDILIGFEDAANPGADSGPYTLNMTAAHTVGPTRTTGPGSSAPTTATVTGPTALTVGTLSTSYTITLGSGAMGSVDFAPASSGFAASVTPPAVSIASGMTTATFVINPSSVGSGSVLAPSPGLTVTPQSGVDVTNPAGATSFTLTGPTGGYANNASTAFTVTPDGTETGTFTPTPVTGVTFSPTTLTWSSEVTGKTFTITKTAPGTVSINGTFSNGLTPPTSRSYTFNPQTYVLSPSSVSLSTSGTLTGVGTGTRYQTVPPILAATGVSGLTLGNPAVTSDTAFTVTYTAGTTTGTATVTDSGNAATTSLTVTPVTADAIYASGVSGFAPGLNSVSYRVYNMANNVISGGSPITAGITERSPGAYAADVTIAGNVRAEVRWSNGLSGQSLVQATDLYNPPSANVVLSGTINANMVSVNGSPVVVGDGNASAVTSNSITIPSTADHKGWTIRILSATTGVNQSAVIASSNTSTGQQTLVGTWPVTPTGTIAYELVQPAVLSPNGTDYVILETVGGQNYTLKDGAKVGLVTHLAPSIGNGTSSPMFGALPTPTRGTAGQSTLVTATMTDATITVNGAATLLPKVDRTATTVRLSST
jgi:hypothetical protein